MLFGGATNQKQLEGWVLNKLATLAPELQPLAKRGAEYGFKSDSMFLNPGVGEADAAKLRAALGLQNDKDWGDFTQAMYAVNKGKGDEFLRKYADETGLQLGDIQATQEEAKGPTPGDIDQRAAITRQIQDFYNRMNAPVTDAAGNITEPIVKQLAMIGRNMGLQKSSSAGIQGGAASLAAAAAAQANSLPYLQQRASLAAGANQLLQNGQMGYEQLNQGAYGLNLRAQDMENEQQQALYNQRVGQGQGLGSTLGGVLGAVGGAFLGNPQMGAQLGTSLGGSIGGQVAGAKTPTPKSYRPYTGS